MEITIGVRNVARELTVEVSEDADTISEAVSKALSAKGDGATLEFTTTKGGRVIVPVAALGFVELGSDEQRRVGFGTL